MEIMIVDDEPQVAEVLATSLKRQGHSTTVVHSGREALDRLKSVAFDAMFLDVSMPGMNGLDVMAEVRRLRPSLVACLSPGLAAAQPVPIAPQFGAPSPQDPQKLQFPLRAPITLLPSITISEEYNDNVLLDNRNRQWDLITGITPAINFIWESRTHRLLAGYNFTSELYLRDPTRDNAFNTQNFTLDSMWRVTEQLTLTLTDA